MPVMFQRQPARDAVIGLIEREFDLVLHVASLALPDTSARSGAARAARSGAAKPAAASEERREEVGEGVRVSEHLLHFFLCHGAEAALRTATSTAEIHVVTGERVGASVRLRLLVHAPVGAELVVLLPLL